MSSSGLALDSRQRVGGHRRAGSTTAIRRVPDARIEHTDSPWGTRQTGLSLAVAAVAVAGQIVCWFGVSGHVTLRQQTPWIAGAVAFGGVSAFAGSMWLIIGLRSMRRARAYAFAFTRTVFGLADAEAGPRAGEQYAPGAEMIVTGPNMTFVHRAECPLARGKQTEPVDRATAQRAGLTRCGVCSP